jgi:1-phosphatidylinositol-3-phosphate 5-kinase
VSGAQLGQSGSLRVCKPCEVIINVHDEDSSDYSNDEMPLPSPFEAYHRSSTAEIDIPAPQSAFDDDDTASIYSQSMEHVVKTPTMAIPATRRTGRGSNRRSAVLEFDSEDRPLPRPSSSRSLKTSITGRPLTSSHKRYHSRHLHLRNFKAYHEERAPFQRRLAEDTQGRLSAFHHDNIIDPDLAQYLSDENSSGDEQPNIFANVNADNLARSVGDGEKGTFGGLLAVVKKGRSRFGDRSSASLLLPSRDGDDASVSSSRAVNLPGRSRRRNLSVASSIHQRLSPGLQKDSPSQSGQDLTPGSLSGSPGTRPGEFKMTRSASMRGAGAPAVELNRASLQHVRKLLHQLLKDSEVPHISSWENALIPIFLKATDDVDPNVQHGDDIDIRHYVKLKKIPGGRPGDTSYVSGLVFTKNLALKSMPRSISQPNIIIITFALEYARHQQHFMSLEPVIRQEREYLENLIGRIAALQPQLLLVQKNVSGLALQLLEKTKIATAYNVKPSVLEAVSRCCQTRIISSMDKLTVKPTHLGKCGSFDVKTYVFNGRKKTYVYLSGCPKELGCTIVLRGADRDTLGKIKRITEFMVYVVYNLKLETCLMRDEFAQIPTSIDDDAGCVKPMNTYVDTLASKMASQNNGVGVGGDVRKSFDLTEVSNADVLKQEGGPSNDEAKIDSAETQEVPEDVPMPTFYQDMVQKHQTKILSASPFVKFMQPYLLMRAREQERRLAYLKRLCDQDISFDETADEKARTQKFVLIKPEMIHESLSGTSAKVREVLHAVHAAEYDKALHNYETQKRQWEAYISGNINLFDPYAYQNIVVLYSLVCTTTSIPCSGPDLLALSFYNEHESGGDFEADCTLGQYVEDLCYGATSICSANGCEEKMSDHHRQYVHGEAQLSVFVQPYPSKLRGMQDTILMWSCCKICGNETQVMPMSDNSWKYSFGKYLELSFWSSNLHARAGVCPHDLHRDHLRFFGYKDQALRIHWDPVNLLEIIVPRTRITWKVDNDLKFRNDVYTKTEQRLTRFMMSVKARLKGINVESILPEKMEDCKHEIETLTKKANDEHVFLIKQLQDRYVNSRYYETVPFNRAVRSTQEKVAEWDAAFAEFERKFFPSEKDIRRLAALQLKKIFLDRDASVTSLTSTEEGSATPPSETHSNEKDDLDVTPTLQRRMTQLSPEKTQDVLASVVEEHANGGLDETLDMAGSHTPLIVAESAVDVKTPIEDLTRLDVKHLDLAVPANFHEHSPAKENTILASSRPVSPTPPRHDLHLADQSPSNDHIDDVALPRSCSQSIEQKNELTSASTGAVNIQPSGIPRPTDMSVRRVAGKTSSPPLLRAQSQPTNIRTEKSSSGSGTSMNATSGSGAPKIGDFLAPIGAEPPFKAAEKKLSERLGLTGLKSAKSSNSHSLIPRSVTNRRKDSKVSSLAKHFEQLSREFEKERMRERKQRAAKSRQSRAMPMPSSKPIIEVYKNVHDAVEEKDPSDEDFLSNERRSGEVVDKSQTIEGLAQTQPAQTDGDGHHAEETTAETTEMEDNAQNTSQAASDVDGDEEGSDLDHSILDDIHIPESPEDMQVISPADGQISLEFPKHERSSLMKMLTNFWAERSASGWMPLDYPLNMSDHVFADCDVIVREDEPSSLIAFALDSEDYKTRLWGIHEHTEEESGGRDPQELDVDGCNPREVEHSLLRATGIHLKYQFQEGPAKMLCKIFYAEQFDAVRRKCGVSERFVESLSRCMKWDSKGGKTKSVFLKTLDDRFVLKSLSPIETQAFLKFAPAYFQIMSEALFHELPSVIAKMLGFYQIIVKNATTGVEFNYFLLVMENLFYDRTPTRIFDLKGSMRNRKIQSTGERNEVLLDENMVEFIYESPLFAREHSKKLLRASVWNDTLFLARQNVMDYSLMIAIDENRKELVVGIIDCIRTYTWDKKLESWIKDRGFAGGGKNRPTVTSPKEYKSRFRAAMARYVLEAPKYVPLVCIIHSKG